MTMAYRCVWAASLALVAAGCAAQAPADEKVAVLVAKKDISAMTYIRKADDFFEIQEKPRGAVPKGAFTGFDDTDIKDGFRVGRTFAAGRLLTPEDLVSKDMDGGSRRPLGKRAGAVWGR